MKKSLFVLSVLSALSGVATAQSSVTVFGILDVNGRYLDNDGVKQYSLSQGGLSASRLGFRGTEDLGGGLAAAFWIEGAMFPDTGTPAGQTWQRRSTVSLLGGWGEARLGRDFTATYLNTSSFDPFGDSGLGAAGNLTTRPPPVPPGGAYNTLVRASNMAAYFLPAGIGGGFYGQAQIAAGENANGNKFVGGRLGYSSGPLNVAVSYGETNVAPGTDGKNANIGGAWDFGVVRLSGFYGQIKVDGNTQDNWFIGASAPVGVWLFRASYGRVDSSGTTPGNVEGQKAEQFAVGAVYDLSRRTQFYGTWSGITNKDGARYVVANLDNIPGGGAAANADSQGFEVGIRHSF